MNQQLIEGKDFYYNDEGKLVMTAQYHLNRGYCCGNGCKHCPYNYINIGEAKRAELLNTQTRNFENK